MSSFTNRRPASTKMRWRFSLCRAKLNLAAGIVVPAVDMLTSATWGWQDFAILCSGAQACSFPSHALLRFLVYFCCHNFGVGFGHRFCLPTNARTDSIFPQAQVGKYQLHYIVEFIQMVACLLCLLLFYLFSSRVHPI